MKTFLLLTKVAEVKASTWTDVVNVPSTQAVVFPRHTLHETHFEMALEIAPIAPK